MAKIGVADDGKNRSVRTANGIDQRDFEAKAKQEADRADLLEKMRAKTQGNS